MIDISVPWTEQLPVWPGSPGWAIRTESWVEGDDDIANSELTSDLHVGTHVEAPRHFLRSGATLDGLGLDIFVGPAYVVDLGSGTVVDAAALESAGVPDGTTRLLLRTSNSAWWPASGEFRPDYVALDESGAQWCVDRGLALVGIDYLSVQSQQAGPETHRILMRSGIAILEGLDLSGVTAGPWELTCLPLPLVGTEAAPARAIVRPLAEAAS